MANLSSGTVTFLFTDIEGSTALWERDRTAMRGAVHQHLALLREAIAAAGGVAFKTVGDAVQAAFATAPPALAAAVAGQRALQAAAWPDATGPLRVRMALHAGMAEPSDGDYLAPCLNRLARLLASGHGEQVLLTETVRQLLEGDLPSGVTLRGLGSHRLRDLSEPEEIFQVLAPGLPEQFPPLRTLPSHLTNLTVPPTTLIGRDAEVATVLRLFDDGARLVTLTGPGGTGKTRLALEIAAEALDRYPDGVFVVDLSPLTEPALVVPTIATTLGVRESAGQALLDTLIGFLVPKRLLLILDNCEQVLDAAPDVAALLASAPHLAILTTSREPLHVRGEREFPLLPLLLPAADRLPAIEDVARTPAVALFVERATASQPDFALTAANVSAVAAICRQLDGLPLAIELAAARVKVLPPAALLSRLEKRLPMLTGGSRDLPARQRTMRDAIAWSYDLLSPEEQTLFRRLSVCVGTFSLAAAEAMAGPDNDLSIVDGIGALIEQSLLLQAPGLGAEPRYLMLEIMREFGLEMLAVASETEGSRERHARYFLGPDDAQVPFAPVIQAPENTALLAAERDNVRVAFVWLDERGEIDALLSRTMLLYRLWFTPGLHHEGQQWIERALERASTAAPLTRFRALDTALTLADHGGDYARAAGYAAEGLALARELGDPLLTGEALTNAGILAYRQGEYGQAEELLLEALGLLREGADRSSDGIALLSLGDTTLAQERFDEAAAWYEESLEAFETTGYPWGLSDTRAGLGAVNVCLGNLKRAAALYSDSLARAQNHGFTMLVISSLLGLAAIAATSGQPETGARLLGAAEETAARLGAPTFPRDNPVRDRALATLTATLDEHQLAAARESGQALALEAAVAEAQSVAERLERSPP